MISVASFSPYSSLRSPTYALVSLGWSPTHKVPNMSFHDCVFDSSGRAWATDVATSSAAMANSAFVIFACASASLFCSTKNSLAFDARLAGALVSIEEGEDGMNNILNARPGERPIAQRCIGPLGHEATSFGHRKVENEAVIARSNNGPDQRVGAPRAPWQVAAPQPQRRVGAAARCCGTRLEGQA